MRTWCSVKQEMRRLSRRMGMGDCRGGGGGVEGPGPPAAAAAARGCVQDDLSASKLQRLTTGCRFS